MLLGLIARSFVTSVVGVNEKLLAALGSHEMFIVMTETGTGCSSRAMPAPDLFLRANDFLGISSLFRKIFR
jgi:hypothetical protein